MVTVGQEPEIATECLHIYKLENPAKAFVVQLFVTPWTAACQAPCPSPSARAFSNSCPLSRDAIQPSHPLLPTSPPALSLSQHWGLFQ